MYCVLINHLKYLFILFAHTFIILQYKDVERNIRVERRSVEKLKAIKGHENSRLLF